MTNTKGSDAGRVEWRINVDGGGRAEILVPESKSLVKTVGRAIKCLVVNVFVRIWTFLSKAWHLGVDDPRKVIHCLKVGIALSVVSLFYYMRPLYEGVGGNAMWAVMTVVVVFEYTVGATLCKCLNRTIGTCLAGFLAVGIHWVASKSGEKFEPIIMGASVFLLASTTTFSRFIPVVKARFDFGALVFILTFSLVSISGYRVEKLLDMAHERLSTIIIGTSLCIFTSMLIFPVWAGGELHFLVTRNITKLANSLDCCVAEYFDDSENKTGNSEGCGENLLAYKCVLNSKAVEESMANLARWEPPHGSFGFQHPWRQYLKIGSAMRNCAYCLEALNSCINSKKQTSELMKKQFTEICRKVNSSISCIIEELAKNLETMNKSSNIDFSMKEMKGSVEDLKTYLKSMPVLFVESTNNSETKSQENDSKKEAVLKINNSNSIPLIEIIPLVTFASLLIEIGSRVEDIVDTVQELAKMADFKQDHQNKNSINSDGQVKDEKTMRTLERV